MILISETFLKFLENCHNLGGHLLPVSQAPQLQQCPPHSFLRKLALHETEPVTQNIGLLKT